MKNDATSSQRCAIYARYSTDKQSPASIADQVRKCREYAARPQSPALHVIDGHVYADEGMSGAGADRPELGRLVRAATSKPRPFDVILVDDTSRISRNLGEAMRLYERLNYHGVRVVAVSQGIDTADERADVLMTVNGLVDSLYIKNLSQKTHRGMEGQVLRGFYPAGRCYGYRNVKTREGARLEIEPAEAAIVRRIFELSAAGTSLRTIAKTLNAERVSAARPRAGKRFATWCPNAIREMLYRKLYIGRIVWNRSRFIKTPGTNKRVRRARPESEWKIVERPELRIVPQETWRAVQARLETIKQLCAARVGQQAGPARRHLLTGFLKCDLCGANLVIVGGRSSRCRPTYGCPNNYHRGTCTNDLRERQDFIEPHFLQELQRAVADSAAIEHAVAEFTRRLKAIIRAESAGADRIETRRAAVEAELRRLTLAVAQGGHSDFLLRRHSRARSGAARVVAHARRRAA